MTRDSIDYLTDMLTAATLAIEFVEDKTFATFQTDLKTQFAVVRALQIVGEAAKKIPDPIRDQYSSVPWKAIAGMRDKLTHDYFGINLHVVWDTVQSDLAPLQESLRQILDDLPYPEPDQEQLN